MTKLIKLHLTSGEVVTGVIFGTELRYILSDNPPISFTFFTSADRQITIVTAHVVYVED